MRNSTKLVNSFLSLGYVCGYLNLNSVKNSEAKVMTQLVKFWLYKHEGLTLDPQHPCRAWDSTLWPVTPAVAGRDRWIPRTYYCPASLAEMASF